MKVVPVYNEEDEDEVKNEVEEPIAEQVEEVIIEEVKTEEVEVEKPQAKSKTKGITMPITEKTLQQVQCSACGKYMSQSNLRYSHPKYCVERNTIETPTNIPIPNIKVKNDEAIKNKIILPVKILN